MILPLKVPLEEGFVEACPQSPAVARFCSVLELLEAESEDSASSSEELSWKVDDGAAFGADSRSASEPIRRSLSIPARLGARKASKAVSRGATTACDKRDWVKNPTD